MTYEVLQKKHFRSYMALVLICVIISCLLPLPSVRAASNNISININFDKHTVCDSETPFDFTVNITNTGSTAIDGTLKIKAATEYGYVAESHEISCAVNAGASALKKVKLENLSLGRYNVTCTFGSTSASQQLYCTGSSYVNPDWGICSHYINDSTQYTALDMSMASKAGFSFIRDDFNWNEFETGQGKLEISQAKMDKIDNILANGNQILAILHYSPPAFYNQTHNADGTISSYDYINEYARFCGFTAEQLKGKVKYFEICNEPNTIIKTYDSTGAEDTSQKGKVYIELLKEAYKAIKKANPEAVVLGVSQAGAIPGENMVNVEFTKQVFAAGGGEFMDALSIHTYPSITGKAVDEIMPDCDTLMNAIEDAMGNVKKPIWVTETGYSSTIFENYEITEEQQGAYMTRIYTVAAANGKIEKLFFYDLKNDFLDGNRVRNQAQFGILYHYGSRPKPAFYMLNAVNKLTGGLSYAGKQMTSNKDNGYYGLSVYRFRSEKKNVFVMWTNGGTEYNLTTAQGTGDNFAATIQDSNAVLTVPAENSGRAAELYDCNGTRYSDGSKVKLGYLPTYVVLQDKESDLPIVESEPYCNISSGENSAIMIDGMSKNANQNVAVYAIDDKSGDFLYFNQMKSDANKAYAMTFDVDETDNFTVYVNAGDEEYTYSAVDSGVLTSFGEKPTEDELTNAGWNVTGYQTSGSGYLKFTAGDHNSIAYNTINGLNDSQSLTVNLELWQYNIDKSKFSVKFTDKDGDSIDVMLGMFNGYDVNIANAADSEKGIFCGAANAGFEQQFFSGISIRLKVATNTIDILKDGVVLCSDAAVKASSDARFDSSKVQSVTLSSRNNCDGNNISCIKNVSITKETNGTPTEFKVTSINKDDIANGKITIGYTNTTANTETGKAIAAYYDADNRFISCELKDVDFTIGGTSADVRFNVVETSAYKTVRVFLWDDLGTMKPLL